MSIDSRSRGPFGRQGDDLRLFVRRSFFRVGVPGVLLLGLGLLFIALRAVRTPEEAQAESRNQTESAEAATPASEGIRIFVKDGSTKRPIAKFRLLAGIPAGRIAEEFAKRTAEDSVNWQPHTSRKGTDGRYVWPLRDAYEKMAIRIEADGYQPQQTPWIRQSDGPQNFLIELKVDPGVEGRVLRPDGLPAAGAMLGIALPQYNLTIVDGRIREGDHTVQERSADRGRRPVVVKADEGGRFRLPTETDPVSAVLVVHESGVRELSMDEFRKQTDITLQRWGRIDGRLVWKDRPGKDESISLIISRDDYGYPCMIQSYAGARTDAKGCFVFEKVMPGMAQIAREISIPETDDGLGKTKTTLDTFAHATIKTGAPTSVVLGGQGRKVIGRLTGRDSWEGVTFKVAPDAPHIGFSGDAAHWKGYAQLQKSEIGPLFFRDGLKPNADGSFELDHMLPGDYQLFVKVPGLKNYAGGGSFSLDPEVTGQVPRPFELKAISVVK